MGIMQATNTRSVRSKQAHMTTRLAALTLIAGCTASAEEVRPPNNELYFPTGAAISPDERQLFVANANSELRFDSGSVAVLPLDPIETVVSDWLANKTVPADCEQDPDHSETLLCEEAPFIAAE